MATELNEGSSRKPPRSPEASGIADLKNHVVQIETLQLYTFIFIGVLFAIERVPPFASNQFLLLLVVSVFFVGLRARLRSQHAGRRLRFGWARRCSIRRIMASLTMVADTSGSSS